MASERMGSAEGPKTADDGNRSETQGAPERPSSAPPANEDAHHQEQQRPNQEHPSRNSSGACVYSVDDIVESVLNDDTVRAEEGSLQTEGSVGQRAAHGFGRKLESDYLADYYMNNRPNAGPASLISGEDYNIRNPGHPSSVQGDSPGRIGPSSIAPLPPSSTSQAALHLRSSHGHASTPVNQAPGTPVRLHSSASASGLASAQQRVRASSDMDHGAVGVPPARSGSTVIGTAPVVRPVPRIVSGNDVSSSGHALADRSTPVTAASDSYMQLRNSVTSNWDLHTDISGGSGLGEGTGVRADLWSASGGGGSLNIPSVAAAQASPLEVHSSRYTGDWSPLNTASPRMHNDVSASAGGGGLQLPRPGSVSSRLPMSGAVARDFEQMQGSFGELKVSRPGSARHSRAMAMSQQQQQSDVHLGARSRLDHPGSARAQPVSGGGAVGGGRRTLDLASAVSASEFVPGSSSYSNVPVSAPPVLPLGTDGGAAAAAELMETYTRLASSSGVNTPGSPSAAGGGPISQESINMQMMALLNAQQQMYAAQIAQLQAINNNMKQDGGGYPGAQRGGGAGGGGGVGGDDYGSGYGGSPRIDHRGSHSRRGGHIHPSSPMARGGRGGGGKNRGDRSAGGFAPRSPLLEEFRMTCSSRVWTLVDIRGHVTEFALDQNGSRFIQQRLEVEQSDGAVMQMVLQESLVMCSRLITDVFGNYVIQKLFELGAAVGAREILCAELQGRVFSLSVHMYGCRVVQKALELVDLERRRMLENELQGHILACIRDQNGNHVIQKCVELSSGKHDMVYIIDAMNGSLIELATHSYGCRVVQRLLEHAPLDLKRPITREILMRVSDLLLDQYGNYVIQHVVEHGIDAERSIVVDALLNQVPKFSQHKYASNVIERCLQFGDKFQRRALIEELLRAGSGSSSSANVGFMCPLHELVRDQFGNYVVQRVLDVAEPDQRERAVALLRSQIEAIKKCSYGKHIMVRLEPGWSSNRGSPRVGNSAAAPSSFGVPAGAPAPLAVSGSTTSGFGGYGGANPKIGNVGATGSLGGVSTGYGVGGGARGNGGFGGGAGSTGPVGSNGGSGGSYSGSVYTNQQYPPQAVHQARVPPQQQQPLQQQNATQNISANNPALVAPRSDAAAPSEYPATYSHFG